MVTGVTENHSTRPTNSFNSTLRQYHDDDTDEDRDTTPRSHEERLLTAIETMPQHIKNTSTNTKLLQTHVLNFRGKKDKFVEFEHRFLNHLSPLAKDLLDLFRKEFAKEDLKEVARYKWDQARYDPTTETFSDFLKSLKKTFWKTGTSFRKRSQQGDKDVLVRQITGRNSARTHNGKQREIHPRRSKRI